MKDNKKDYMGYVIYLLALIIVVGTLSYAFFNQTFSSNREVNLNTGTLLFEYNEKTSDIILTNPEGMNDLDGIKNGGSFLFDVKALSDDDSVIHYTIYLTEEEGNSLDKKYFKLALLNGDDNQLVAPIRVGNLSSFSKKSGSLLLYEDEIKIKANVESSNSYSLKYWASEDIEELDSSIVGDKQTIKLNGGTFKFKVNVMSN